MKVLVFVFVLGLVLNIYILYLAFTHPELTDAQLLRQFWKEYLVIAAISLWGIHFINTNY